MTLSRNPLTGDSPTRPSLRMSSAVMRPAYGQPRPKGNLAEHRRGGFHPGHTNDFLIEGSYLDAQLRTS